MLDSTIINEREREKKENLAALLSNSKSQIEVISWIVCVQFGIVKRVRHEVIQ